MTVLIRESNVGNQSRPLFVRVPEEAHEYLEEIKRATGISKSDSITLFLYLAKRLISSEKLQEMYDEYMLDGEVTKVFNPQ